MTSTREQARTVALRRLEVPCHGAEDVVVDEEGHVFTGTEDGSVYRVAPSGAVRRVGRTGGRPLGLELLGPDRLLVCDAEMGLLAMSRTTGVVERLATEVGGRRIRVCNNAAVTAAGDVWFSDSSTAYPLARWRTDLAEHTRTGRLLRRRADGTVEVHLRGLAFANGVALAADESYVCVAETGGRRVVRLWLAGERAGQSETFVADLPGYPDNLSLGSDGLVWVTLAAPFDPVLDLVQHRLPRRLGRRLGRAVARVATRLPLALQPSQEASVHVRAYDDDARLVHDLHASTEHFHLVTGVREHHGDVWLGSLEESAVAVLPGAAV